MSSLTFEDNGTNPIAVIDDDKYIFIDEAPPSEKLNSEGEILNTIFNEDTILIIADLLQEGKTLRDVIDLLKPELDDEPKTTDEININEDEKLSIMPILPFVNIFVGGPSGAGKSYWIAEYIQKYHMVNPDNMIYLFVRTDEDPAFEYLPEHEQIVMNSEIMDRNLAVEDFADSIVVFDDSDSIQDKTLSIFITKLVGDLMSCGRKLQVSTIFVSHIFMNSLKTKIPLNESQLFTFFPGLGDAGIIKVLQAYAGMKMDEINRILSLKSRWVTLYRNRPRYIIHEKGVFLL